MAHGTGYDGGATGMMLGVTIPKWYLWWTRIISHLSRWMMFGKGNDPYLKHISFPRSYLNLLINVRCVKVEPNTIICSAAINACAKAGQWRRRWFLGWHGMTWDDMGRHRTVKLGKNLEDLGRWYLPLMNVHTWVVTQPFVSIFSYEPMGWDYNDHCGNGSLTSSKTGGTWGCDDFAGDSILRGLASQESYIDTTWYIIGIEKQTWKRLSTCSVCSSLCDSLREGSLGHHNINMGRPGKSTGWVFHDFLNLK